MWSIKKNKAALRRVKKLKEKLEIKDSDVLKEEVRSKIGYMYLEYKG